MFDFSNNSHRRYNPLTKSWVLCSPHRTQRPWQGQQEGPDMEQRPEYDPKCYLCPGNVRANGEHNPKYDSTFRFPNDYAAVKVDQPVLEANDDDLIKVEGVRGECHVICFSPRHDLTLAEMSVEEIKKVVDIWTSSYLEMQKKSEYINHVQIFENKGAAMGCSNPHPHGQMWCTERVPEEPSKELAALKEYKSKHDGKCLLCDYAQREMADPERKRTVFENDTFLVVVPFWAVWPFELMVLPKTHIGSLPEMSEKQKEDLADAVRRVTCRYDNLFKTSFPYSMGIHQKPFNGEYDFAHLHLHYYPPLLRSATVRKFLVGFEMLGEPQRDLTPEQAAARLRDLPEVHYKTQQMNGKH
ncbi:MAG: galactose-1-phosphate uridylyltransferase [Benjaminiella poitrasii]|nr:MAG: galactose-1-phosphate uridylyltransferase [Benjaminiella poitrasii]